jgi:hypothetical protein
MIKSEEIVLMNKEIALNNAKNTANKRKVKIILLKKNEKITLLIEQIKTSKHRLTRLANQTVETIKNKPLKLKLLFVF